MAGDQHGVPSGSQFVDPREYVAAVLSLFAPGAVRQRCSLVSDDACAGPRDLPSPTAVGLLLSGIAAEASRNDGPSSWAPASSQVFVRAVECAHAFASGGAQMSPVFEAPA